MSVGLSAIANSVVCSVGLYPSRARVAQGVGRDKKREPDAPIQAPAAGTWSAQRTLN